MWGRHGEREHGVSFIARLNTERGGGTNAQVRLGTFTDLCCPLWVDAKDRQRAPAQLAPWSPWGCFWVHPCALECAERRDADVFRLTCMCSFWHAIYLWEWGPLRRPSIPCSLPFPSTFSLRQGSQGRSEEEKNWGPQSFPQPRDSWQIERQQLYQSPWRFAYLEPDIPDCSAPVTAGRRELSALSGCSPIPWLWRKYRK